MALIILSLVVPTGARTRLKSLENFIVETRISNEGFANTPDGEVTIPVTTFALEISSEIKYEVNNTLDILLYYQSSQNADGGFGYKPDASSDWDSTISAIQGLNYVNINATLLQNWLIFDYLNQTAEKLLYTDTGNNLRELKNLTISNMKIWREYILSSFKLGGFPTVDIIPIILQLKNFQFPNGTYNSFDMAVETALLLDLLGDYPDQVELASKFIRAFSQNNAAFSSAINGTTTLKSTYLAISALMALDKLNELEDQDDIVRFILNQQATNSGFSEIDSNSITITDSWYAIKTLVLLDQMDELYAPDVLQDHGFISFDSIFMVLSLVVITFWRKKK